MVRHVEIEWFHTECFKATVAVEDDFDLTADNADEVLDEIICNMDQPELSAAFDGCTERAITFKREAL
jgi:hypothetical protein